MTSNARVRCRNQRCRSKLPIATDDTRPFAPRFVTSSTFTGSARSAKTRYPGEDIASRAIAVGNELAGTTTTASATLFAPRLAAKLLTQPEHQPDSKSPCGTGTFLGLKNSRTPAWVHIAGPLVDPINLMIPLESAFAARLAKMHGQILEKVRRAAEEKALLKRHHPPVNVVGGYRFPNAPEIDVSLAEPAKAEDHDFGDLSIPDFLRRPING